MKYLAVIKEAHHVMPWWGNTEHFFPVGQLVIVRGHVEDSAWQVYCSEAEVGRTSPWLMDPSNFDIIEEWFDE